MSISTFLDNSMRHGVSTYNARLSVSGTIVSLTDYAGLAFGAVNPLLIRYSPTSDCAVVGAVPSLNFGTASWGIPPNDGLWVIYLGLQKLSANTVQIVACLSLETGSVTTLLPANAVHPYHVVGSAVATGEIVWVQSLHNVVRANGAWDTTITYLGGV